MSATQDSDNDHGPEIPTALLSLVQRFEDAWQRGGQPALADYLPADGSQRQEVLAHLVHVDLERRVKAGEQLGVAAYLERYPELAAHPDLVVELLAREYELRRCREPKVTVEEYLRQFPSYREGLLARLQVAAQEAGAAMPTAAPARQPTATVMLQELAGRRRRSAVAEDASEGDLALRRSSLRADRPAT
jgi:hypothetical protein